jgi:hypothetical protein
LVLTIAGGIILGWLGIVVIRAVFTGPAQRPPTRTRPTLEQLQRRADEETFAASNPEEVRANVTELHFVLAVGAAAHRISFEEYVCRVDLQRDEDRDNMRCAVMARMFAVDTMRDLTWTEATTKIKALGDDQAAIEIRRWRERRLGPYFHWRTKDWARVASNSGFRKFVRDVDVWVQGRAARPPEWRDD